MQRPNIIVLFSSFRCNSHCNMCTIWKKQNDYGELTPEQIGRIFARDIIRDSVQIVNLTGGEPTLRDDLLDVVKALLAAGRNIRRIDIPTNGINTEQVIDQVEQLLAFLLATDVRLSVTVSVDGVNDVHDRIRGIPGAFVKIDKTLDELKELMGLYPGLNVGMNATISRLNCRHLAEIVSYADRKSLGINFTLAAISDIGAGSRPLSGNFDFDKEESEGIVLFLEDMRNRGLLMPKYIDFLIHWLKTGHRLGKCAFRSGKSLLCEPDGSFFRCGNFEDFKMGNMLDGSFKPNTTWKFQRLYEEKCKTCNSNCYIDTI